MSLTARCFVSLVGFCVFAVPTAALGQPEARGEPFESKGSKGPASSGRYFVGRLALLGGYSRIFDVSALGAGGELSLGGEGALHGGHGIMRVVRGETGAGLTVTEISVLGSYELHLSSWRLGIGGGATLLKIRRATTGGDIDGAGIVALGRVGYDFGERSGPYVLGQFEVQSTNAWGPTFYVGYRL